MIISWNSLDKIVPNRDPDKVRIFIPIMPISSPNPMSDHLLESSHIGFGEEITQVESNEIHFTTLIWSSG